MAHVLADFTREVSEYDWPTVACPTCKVGSVPYGKVEMFEAPLSASWHDHESWDIDMVYGTFMGALKCTNPQCQQTVIVTGTFRVVTNEGDPKYGQYGELYRLQSFDPPLTLIEVPPTAPQTVKDAVDAAAKIVWLDPNAAANRLRTAVERTLDDRKVRKSLLTKKNTRQRLKAHDRIKEFGAKNQSAGDAMMAVKWIGNEGTHESELTVEDVLEGSTFLQMALKAVYDTSEAEAFKRIKAINKAKRLPRKKTP